MARVILIFKKNVIKDYPFVDESLNIGRDKGNDIVIDNLIVSSFHARIDRVGDSYILTDLQSTNGTFVNKKKVISCKLKHKDKITIGKHLLFFAMSKKEQLKAEEEDMDQTMIIDSSIRKNLLAKKTGDSEEVMPKKEEKIGIISFLDASDKEDIELNKKLIRIGKAKTSEIQLKGFFIPLTAAAISRRPNGYVITSTSDKMKVKVNGKIIEESYYLKDFDTIDIGSHKLQFYTKDSEDIK
jgi:pSer/pThr/pTyr-binding forkhead associated (FHA) protein